MLTAAEHYVAHQLLVKIYPDKPGLVSAVLRMSSKIKKNSGGGRSKNKLFDWIRRKHSENMIGKPNPSATESNKRRKGKPNGRKGIPCLPQTKAKISKKLTGRIGKSNSNRKKVYCVELDMIFNNCDEAAKYVGLKYSKVILQVAKGQHRSSGGYTWRFVNSDNTIDNFVSPADGRKSPRSSRAVLCIELNRIFRSTIEAAKFAGLKNYSDVYNV